MLGKATFSVSFFLGGLCLKHFHVAFVGYLKSRNAERLILSCISLYSSLSSQAYTNPVFLVRLLRLLPIKSYIEGRYIPRPQCKCWPSRLSRVLPMQ